METALEHILTTSYKADLIAYMAVHPEDFEEVIRLAVSDKQPYAWRAAWLLWSCMEENDQRIQGYIKNIIETLSSTNDNLQRELLIILQHLELNEEDEGILFEVCVTIWEKINKKPSIRINAFKMMIKIARKYPDLSHEIVFLTQDQYLDSLSVAAQKSISKLIKEINL
jgi:hypothetical protein